MAAEHVLAYIGHRDDQPGLLFLRRAEALAGADEPGKGLLGRVLGVKGIFHVGKRHTVHRVQMFSVDVISTSGCAQWRCVHVSVSFPPAVSLGRHR